MMFPSHGVMTFGSTSKMPKPAHGGSLCCSSRHRIAMSWLLSVYDGFTPF
jgi:hypothetical protein